MILRVLPSTLSGDAVWAPPSKSIMQRVVAIATLADGRTMTVSYTHLTLPTIYSV